MQYVPRNLYRYRPLRSTTPDKDYDRHLLKRLCSEIREHQLFAAEVSALNDPFEGTGVVPYVRNAGSTIPMNLGFLPPSARDYTRGFRLISMTERYNSPQMWAHYATGYCGVCLCYDVAFLRGRIDAVRYSDVPILEDGYRADELILRKNELATAALLVKQKDWAYEQEWRAIFPSEETNGGYVSCGQDDLWAVIIGHNTPKIAQDEIRKICQETGAQLYLTAPQELRYALGIWPDEFSPSSDGRTIEIELQMFYDKTGFLPFEELANVSRGSTDLAMSMLGPASSFLNIENSKRQARLEDNA